MKKVAALAIMMVIALAASQPAMAGVGGCRVLGGSCGGGTMLTASGPQEQTPTVLDTVGGALPLDVYTFLKALFTQKGNDGGVVEAPQTPTTSGVGGCGPRTMPGVGGCVL